MDIKSYVSMLGKAIALMLLLNQVYILTGQIIQGKTSPAQLSVMYQAMNTVHFFLIFFVSSVFFNKSSLNVSNDFSKLRMTSLLALYFSTIFFLTDPHIYINLFKVIVLLASSSIATQHVVVPFGQFLFYVLLFTLSFYALQKASSKIVSSRISLYQFCIMTMIVLVSIFLTIHLLSDILSYFSTIYLYNSSSYQFKYLIFFILKVLVAFSIILLGFKFFFKKTLLTIDIKDVSPIQLLIFSILIGSAMYGILRLLDMFSTSNIGKVHFNIISIFYIVPILILIRYTYQFSKKHVDKRLYNKS